MVKLAGLASNRGRNLLRIYDIAPGSAEFAVVATNHEGAPVVESASERGIPTEVIERDDGESRAGHERRLLERLDPYDFDLVLLDGYMRVLTDEFLDRAPTTLNVHPSLLPAFQGANAHEEVLQAGVRTSGCTVHVVTEAVDDGPIVTQEPVPVYADDDESTLKQRVRERAEYVAYPRAVRWFAEDRVSVERDEEGRPTDVHVDGDVDDAFPERRLASSDRVRRLRYGENPHQNSAVYADPTCDEPNVVGAEQRNDGAKALSYNNYNDADAALGLVREFEEPAAAVIKHANPAGCAIADSLVDAYDRALRTDAKSAFGGIVSLNRTCDVETAERIVDSFKEVVVAPGYSDGAVEVLGERSDLRVLDVGPFGEASTGSGAAVEGAGHPMAEKPIVGGRLLQERDEWAPTADDLEIVTEREPTDAEIETMLFAWKTLKHVKSNGIVFAIETETVGLGVGQVSRVDAVNIAAMKADRDADGKSAEGAVMASDAFFPFPDGIEDAAEVGIEAVIQPGGSVNDADVIEAADDHGMAMAFTGRRCFRHD